MLEGLSLAVLEHQHDAVKLAALAGVVLLTWWAIGVIRSTVKWIRIGVGCHPMPAAPEGNALLGHALALAPPNSAWEKMYEWLRQSPNGLLRFRILYRTGILVGDPMAIKRIFQVGGRRRCRCRLLLGGAARLPPFCYALNPEPLLSSPGVLLPLCRRPLCAAAAPTLRLPCRLALPADAAKVL
jgi:hypothetical protein